MSRMMHHDVVIHVSIWERTSLPGSMAGRKSTVDSKQVILNYTFYLIVLGRISWGQTMPWNNISKANERTWLHESWQMIKTNYPVISAVFTMKLDWNHTDPGYWHFTFASVFVLIINMLQYIHWPSIGSPQLYHVKPSRAGCERRRGLTLIFIRESLTLGLALGTSLRLITGPSNCDAARTHCVWAPPRLDGPVMSLRLVPRARAYGQTFPCKYYS